jgi:hypothetical protein
MTSRQARTERRAAERKTETAVDEKRLALLLRYQTTHERAFHKALNTLRKLQKERLRDSKSGFVRQNQRSEAA